MQYFEPLKVQTDANGYPVAITLPRFPPRPVQTVSVEAQPGRTVFVTRCGDQDYRLHCQVNDVWVLESHRNLNGSRKQSSRPETGAKPMVQEHLAKYLERLPEQERALALQRIKDHRGKAQQWVDFCEDNWRDRPR